MNELPSGVQILLGGFSESPQPQVQRDEMERGPVNQELINSRLRWEMPVQFLMESKQALTDMLAWYTRTIRVIGFFDMRHPRTGEVIRARLVEGKMEQAVPIAPDWRASTINATIEYWTGPEVP